MKICFIYNSIFTLGGIQRCISNLSNYFVRNGHEVTVICCDKKINIDRKMYNLDNRVNIIHVKESFLKSKLMIYRLPLVKINNRYGLFKNNYSILKNIYFSFYNNIKSIIKEKNFDVVIGSGVYFNSLLSTINTGNKVKIGWQHSSYYFYFEEEGYKNKDAIANHMFKNLDSYIVLTDDDKKKIKKNWDYETVRIYNAIDKIPDQSGKYENKKFIAAGRLSAEKRFDLLIKNFHAFSKENEDWTLDIYGEGSEKQYLQNLIDKLNLNNRVKLCGYSSNMNEKYLGSSIYCMTSIGEGFGMTVVEAMSCGLPIISYGIPSMKEILNDSCSFCVEEGNHREFVDKMLMLTSNKTTYNYLSKNAKYECKDFAIENIGNQWLEIIDDLNKKKGN